MNTVVRLDDHRPIDPVEDEQIRTLLAKWYSFSIGGTESYGPVILTPFLANPETDPLHELRYSMPKVMLVLQPCVAAWAARKICTLETVVEAVHSQPEMVVREWLSLCCEIGVIEMRQNNNGDVLYTPARNVVYRALEIIIGLQKTINDLQDNYGDAFAELNRQIDWVDIETALPK